MLQDSLDSIFLERYIGGGDSIRPGVPHLAGEPREGEGQGTRGQDEAGVVAVRILAWFPDATTVVVTLVGGDKGPVGDVWYSSAAPRAEASIDQWKREQRRR